MSAVLSVIRTDRIEILTDCAAISEEGGRVVAHAEKIIQLPGLPGAIAALGTVGAVHQFIRDFVVPRLASTLDETLKNLSEGGGAENPTLDAVVLLAGWSETRGPGHYVLGGGDAAKAFGVDPYRPHPLGPLVSLGPEKVDAAEALGADFDPFRDGIEERGPRLFQAWRRAPVTHPRQGAEPLVASGVGAQLQFTTISPTGVVSRAIGYWPDWIGRPIDPARKFVPII